MIDFTQLPKAFAPSIAELRTLQEEYKDKYKSPKELGVSFTNQASFCWAKVDAEFRKAREPIRQDWWHILINANQEDLSQISLWDKTGKANNRRQRAMEKEWGQYTLQVEPVYDLEFLLWFAYLFKSGEEWADDLAKGVFSQVEGLRKGRVAKFNRSQALPDRQNAYATINMCDVWLKTYQQVQEGVIQPTDIQCPPSRMIDVPEAYRYPNKFPTAEPVPEPVENRMPAEKIARVSEALIKCPRCSHKLEIKLC